MKVNGEEYTIQYDSMTYEDYEELREVLREDGCELVYDVESEVENEFSDMVPDLDGIKRYVEEKVREWLEKDPEAEIPEAERTIMEYGLLDDGYGVYEPTGNYWEYDPQAGRWKKY